VVTINGYEPFEVIVDTPQFSLMRVEDLLHHEKFIAKVCPHPTEQQVQSLKKVVQLVIEKEWKDAVQPLNVLLQNDAITIIFKNAVGYTLQQFVKEHKKVKSSEFIPLLIGICSMLTSFHRDTFGYRA
jgi:hypothetical protein